MRILIATQYFTPEITAPAARVGEFAAGLARKGHEVKVVCEVPNHPGGVVAPGYGGRLVDRRQLNGFEVDYVWVYATPKKTAPARIANYLSYAASGTIAGARRGPADVIIASSPPLPVGSVGAALAIRHRAPWILDVRDPWPEVAVTLGEVGDGPLLRAAERFERRLYRSAAAITTTTKPFKTMIEERGGAGKVTVISNGATPSFLAAGERDPEPELTGERDGRFVWTYAGNLGLAQGLESAVEAARLLGEGFRLILIGDGPRREALRELAAELPAGQAEVRDAIPPAEIARLNRASDALLVALAPIPGLEGFVPSKLFDCCAMGRPVVLAAVGESVRLTEDAGAAISVPPGDAAALADAVRRLRDDSKLAGELGARGREFAERNSREMGVETLDALARTVAAAPG
jgi:putative colanic acid biosynthesis glycosyltransferase WcaI